MAFLCFTYFAYERLLQMFEENMFRLLQSSQKEPVVIVLEEERLQPDSVTA